jgi:hypothetical protein
MRKLRNHRERKQRQLESMENYFMDAFSPVAPSQEFVSDLRTQLRKLNIPQPIPPERVGKYTFLAVLAVLGGGLFLAFFIRFMVTLVAIVAFLRLKRYDQSTT